MLIKPISSSYLRLSTNVLQESTSMELCSFFVTVTEVKVSREKQMVLAKNVMKVFKATLWHLSVWAAVGPFQRRRVGYFFGVITNLQTFFQSVNAGCVHTIVLASINLYITGLNRKTKHSQIFILLCQNRAHCTALAILFERYSISERGRFSSLRFRLFIWYKYTHNTSRFPKWQ